MIARGNEGPSITGLAEAPDSSKTEMAAYDALGPLTRRVLDDEMPVAFSARKTLEALTANRANPKSPSVDRAMAQYLRQSIDHIRRQIAVEDSLPVHKAGHLSRPLAC